MQNFLILRLRGVMQAWGGHTYEDYRPSHNIPTRSGLEGLLAACLGIDRDDLDNQRALSDSFSYAIRADEHIDIQNTDYKKEYYPQKIIDFHTVKESRMVKKGKVNTNAIISRREYLCDSLFIVALSFNKHALYDLQTVAKAIQKPIYTPFLGRRSCPLTAPLYDDKQTAEHLHAALISVPANNGWKPTAIYSNLEQWDNTSSKKFSNSLAMRDQRIFNGKRQFHTRMVYIYPLGDE